MGNITLNGKPNSKNMKYGICLDCFEKTQEIPIDESFSDQFGEVRDWSVGSKFCGGTVAQGKIYLDVYSFPVAKKDHLDKKGKSFITKGEKYLKRIRKGYFIDEDGKHNGFCIIVKRKIP